MSLDENQTFLKWAGGKRRMVHRLMEFLPSDVRSRYYHEPFLGAGSMFLAVRPKRARLADLNPDLVSAFRFVRDKPALLQRYLRTHAQRDSESYYYASRDHYNRAPSYSCAQAARFIYLNRTCFNGVFRVNRQGRFNVPYGRRERTLFPSDKHLKNLSAALRSAVLRACKYEESLRFAKEGHFVYLDPPYPPINGTSFFRHYTPDRFGEGDQRKLFDSFAALDARGCRVMMSNADTSLIRRLYSSYHVAVLEVTRSISCKNTKLAVSELVITNYSPPREQSTGTV